MEELLPLVEKKEKGPLMECCDGSMPPPCLGALSRPSFLPSFPPLVLDPATDVQSVESLYNRSNLYIYTYVYI